MAALDDLLRQAARRGGSALHLAGDRPPRLRLHGTLTSLSEQGGDGRVDADQLIEEVAPKEAWARYRETGATDFTYELEGSGTFHVHAFRRQGGTGAIVRHAAPAATLEDRGLPTLLKGLTRVRGGLVLATGPKGAGKSTTLHAMIREIDSRLMAHVVTVEEPIRLVLAPTQIALSQREVGVHTASVASGIREGMSMGADVIYASHLPDAASVSAAFGAAERGTLVLAAIASGDVVRGLENLVERFVRERRPAAWRRLAHTLAGATSQVLLPSRQDRSRGGGTSAHARLPAVELLVNGRAFVPAIRDGNGEAIRKQLDRQSQKGDAAQSLDDALVDLVRSGKIRAEDAHDHARDKGRVARARPGGPAVGA